MTAPLPVCSAKLSIVGISQYYGERPRWNTEFCYFCCLKCQRIWLYNGTSYFWGSGINTGPKLLHQGRREEDARIYLVQYFLCIYKYFLILKLQIILRIYHHYPPLATLTHKPLCINELLELEMTKIQFSFMAKPTRVQHMHQSPSRCWARIYPKQRILLFIEGIFQH